METEKLDGIVNLIYETGRTGDRESKDVIRKKMFDTHIAQFKIDPYFYTQAMVYACSSKDVRRDLRVVATCILINHSNPNTQRFARMVGQSIFSRMSSQEAAECLQLCVKTHGSASNSLKVAALDYVRRREDDEELFLKSIKNGKSHLKELYAMLHIKPSPQAAGDLRLNKGGGFTTIRESVSAKSTFKSLSQETLIDMVNSGALGINEIAQLDEISYELLEAVISKMSVSEIIARLKQFELAGIFNHPILVSKITELISSAEINTKKLELMAKVDSRFAASVVKASEERSKTANEEKITKFGGVNIAIDISSSMSSTIKIAKIFIEKMLKLVPKEKIKIVAYNSYSRPVQPDAVEHLSAAGGTQLESIKNHIRIDYSKLVIISDQDDNDGSAGHMKVLKNLIKDLDVTIIDIDGGHREYEIACQKANIPCTSVRYNGDISVINKLTSSLVSGSTVSLVGKIANVVLPTYKRRYTK